MSLYAPIGKSNKGGFHCKKHRLTMFSLNYCPICVAERLNKRKRKEVSS